MACIVEKPSQLNDDTFNQEEFWKKIPQWQNVSYEEFSSSQWQSKNTVLKQDILLNLFSKLATHSFCEDVAQGLTLSPMNIRLTPYIISLINWDDPYSDPIRKQFIPCASERKADHPNCMDDSLNEDADSPVPLLTHRYPDKVLFLPLTVCPVYCNFCTRSRLIGGSTDIKDKPIYGPNHQKWEQVFTYIKNNPAINDVVISGGDSFMLAPRNLELIGRRLLDIPNIKRIRYATKGISVLPMKILDDIEWMGALKSVHEHSRNLGKEMAIHTHFNHPNEITEWTRQAMNTLFNLGIKVRNQSVLLEGVNNNASIMKKLIKGLSDIHVQPYYLYIHDMVSNCEHFRTTLKDALFIDKHIQGCTAGFNIPSVVCDLPSGGGKRKISTYEFYDEISGISLWTSPTVKPGKIFHYFDPIHRLSKEGQKLWTHPAKIKEIMSSMVSKLEGSLT